MHKIKSVSAFITSHSDRCGLALFSKLPLGPSSTSNPRLAEPPKTSCPALPGRWQTRHRNPVTSTWFWFECDTDLVMSATTSQTRHQQSVLKKASGCARGQQTMGCEGPRCSNVKLPAAARGELTTVEAQIVDGRDNTTSLLMWMPLLRYRWVINKRQSSLKWKSA